MILFSCTIFWFFCFFWFKTLFHFVLLFVTVTGLKVLTTMLIPGTTLIKNGSSFPPPCLLRAAGLFGREEYILSKKERPCRNRGLPYSNLSLVIFRLCFFLLHTQIPHEKPFPTEFFFLTDSDYGSSHSEVLLKNSCS